MSVSEPISNSILVSEVAPTTSPQGDPYLVEQAAHRKLSDKREAKEWFRASLDDGVLVIRSVADGKIQVENFIKADKDKILVDERIQLERDRKEEADKKRKEAAVKRREEEEAERARRAEELRLQTDEGKIEKYNSLRPVARRIIEKCTSREGIIFKTKKIHPNRATSDELFSLFQYICLDNDVECVLDLKLLEHDVSWWDEEWEKKNYWVEEAYKRIAAGKVEDKILKEFVFLISGHAVNRAATRSVWRLEYDKCKEAVEYLKRKYPMYKSLNFYNPRPAKKRS